MSSLLRLAGGLGWVWLNELSGGSGGTRTDVGRTDPLGWLPAFSEKNVGPRGTPAKHLKPNQAHILTQSGTHIGVRPPLKAAGGNGSDSVSESDGPAQCRSRTDIVMFTLVRQQIRAGTLSVTDAARLTVTWPGLGAALLTRSRTPVTATTELSRGNGRRRGS
ncbi:hypothetical protein BaRGS_00002725 [Batillaria attramentaria]|uniref:Uncharacterized protein n=1 Tax=Batillaria attramentaria TaxID=370345 RepID=A0ABD0M2U6_9CAEN